jgi:pseudaminic acid cytidylyltransferase
MNIAVIPARGGSKRIPHKNIKEFYGKPMIAYAISAAKESCLFDHIVVSTDDENIAEIARSFGAETPFMRPPELADDHTPTVPVIAHAIKACQILGWKFNQVCCIYPSVPLLQTDDLRGARVLSDSGELDYCFPVTEYPSSIWRSLKLLNNGKIQALYPEFALTRTQDLNSTYYDAGQFYWGKVDAWLTNANIHSNGVGYPIPNWRVVDIDTQNDWQRAELLYRAMNNSISEL